MGRIILARFLERPLSVFERIVRRTDEEVAALNLDRAASAPAVLPRTLPGAAWDAGSRLPARALARAQHGAGGPAFLYRSPLLAREYAIDEAGFDAFLAAQKNERDRIRALRLLSRMRLVSSRNRLTHAVLSALVQEQAAFVQSGDPVELRPLAQKRIVETLRRPRDGDRCPSADASRVSRILQTGSILVGPGTEVELRRLCPSGRQVHRELVRDLVRREQARMVAGEVEGPLTDRELAEAVRRRCRCGVSRRVVAFIRQELGIPDHHERARRGCYLNATAGFSNLRPAVAETIRADVPKAPGVYEVRAEPPGPEYPAGRCPIIYLGSSKDLRKRLLDQVRGNGRNARLSAYLDTGRAQVRWMVAYDGWRRKERQVYEQFVGTFGAPPECNRMSP